MTSAPTPICTEADYEAAMAEVATLWGAATHSPNGDRLDVLATQIDAYEAKHYPMDSNDPEMAINLHSKRQGVTR